MDVLQMITNACDALTNANSPTINAMGLRMVIYLATIMMSWFGIQEALAAQGHGRGFDLRQFYNFVVLGTFAFVFVKFYDTPIPGLGYSLPGFIKQGTNYLVDVIGTDATNQMLTSINHSIATSGPGMLWFTQPYFLTVYVIIQMALSLLAALVSVVIAYGVVGASIVGLVGPVFIPFFMIEQLEWLFWGWVKAFVGFEFYKVVAAAAMSILSHFYLGYYQTFARFDNPVTVIKFFPVLSILVLINVFILIKIPAITATLMTGNVGGHGTGGLFTRLLQRV